VVGKLIRVCSREGGEERGEGTGVARVQLSVVFEKQTDAALRQAAQSAIGCSFFFFFALVPAHCWSHQVRRCGSPLRSCSHVYK
jgi:hypothetical protein